MLFEFSQEHVGLGDAVIDPLSPQKSKDLRTSHADHLSPHIEALLYGDRRPSMVALAWFIEGSAFEFVEVVGGAEHAELSEVGWKRFLSLLQPFLFESLEPQGSTSVWPPSLALFLPEFRFMR